VAADHAIPSLAATLIGTQYRMPVDLAVRAFVDGLAGSAASVLVRWSIPDDQARELARAAVQRVGLG